MKITFPMLSVFVVLSVGSDSRGQTEEDLLKRRFLSEYPEACRLWESKRCTAVGAVRCTVDNPSRNKASRTEAVVSFMCKLPGMARFEIAEDKGGRTERTVEVLSKRYSLTLNKTSDQNQFSLRSLDEDQQALPSSKGGRQRRPKPLLIKLLDLGYSCMVPNMSIISYPRFTVRSVSRLTRNGKNLLRVEFDRPNRADHVARKNAIDIGGFEGFWVVSPEEKWVLYEYECREKKGAPPHLYTGTVDYGGTLDGFLIPRRAIQQQFELPGRKLVTSATYDFQDFKFADVLDDQFTLAAFGIPEEVAVKPLKTARGHSVAYWCLALALVALAAAVAFKIASSRVKPVTTS